MIEVIVDFNADSFDEKINKLINERYTLVGAEVAKNKDNYYPFIYTAILIKKL